MKQILVVDDSDEWRRTIKNMLSEAGYFVIEAGSGRKALQIARSLKADLVLMDFGMPYLNGLETAEQLRNVPGFEFVPIVLLTAEEFPGDCLHTLLPYVTGYMNKGDARSQLVDCVEAHL